MESDQSLLFFSVPGLRAGDVAMMPRLQALTQRGDHVPLRSSFPAVTWPVQANMLTGCLPSEHGVIANGFYWRDAHEVEMWTAWNDKILRPQVWDVLRARGSNNRTAVWFPMLSKGCGADFVCMPAPIHNPDGSESLWCYTKPTEYYGALRDRFGHFPLQHFWGPLAGRPSSQWILDTAAFAFQQLRPSFFYIYLPHLDYAAQKFGPNSPQALSAVRELDEMLGVFFDSLVERMQQTPRFIMVSEYVITDVSHVSYPNRILREAGLLQVKPERDGADLEQLDFANSDAWALVDHQFSHVFIRDGNPSVIHQVEELFRSQQGIAEVLIGEERSKYQMNHERSGECILISTPDSWQAYYWWFDDAKAPSYARTVDIHRKPGYDPVELHFDPVNRCIPLDASLIGGSHGAPATEATQLGIALTNFPGGLGSHELRDIDLFQKMMDAVK